MTPSPMPSVARMLALAALAVTCAAMPERTGERHLVAAERTAQLARFLAEHADGISVAEARAHLGCGTGATEATLRRLVDACVAFQVLVPVAGSRSRLRTFPIAGAALAAPLPSRLVAALEAEPDGLSARALRARFPDEPIATYRRAIARCLRAGWITAAREAGAVQLRATRGADVRTASPGAGVRTAVQLRGVPRALVAGCRDPACECPIRTGDYDVRGGQLVRAVCRRTSEYAGGCA